MNDQRNNPDDNDPPVLSNEEKAQFADLLWAQNDPDVAAAYPDMIVAVYNRQIQASGEDTKAVLDQLLQKGIDRRKVTLTTIFGPGIMLAD